MKKNYKMVNGKFEEVVHKIRVGHVLTILVIIVISALIYLNV